ncbi:MULTISPECIES: TetR/AcrR family transcriptional regulator [unclassified Streptomyces]|uniref:TetR/AcrR family transcriptional regulator n=1 Tax=unclassified Streptomyces TaxID=2593676 RepID=UPI001F034081|nr:MULTISPECIES: TetR/AcrR family transcriptional regulator [unclassified Streptomyces]MCH0566226.1 TetR/AcrR family transcriptional regulator [Streptomyces sp. MUM 2J]MCH0568393.1 TetR/AcrR family transcriptional regulator [Streptomyces sp. MUM 136J]
MQPTPPPSRPAAASAAQPVSRRERNKQDKIRRILDAATELFAERGYSAVATQEVADAADVGTGTLFRYAGSKAGLLMLVMNEQLRLGVERGITLSRNGTAPTEAVLALVAPLVESVRRHPENTAAYQRETLFGSGPEREEAAAHVARVECAIEEILRRYVATGPVLPGSDLEMAAHVIYSTMYMDIVRVCMGRAPADGLTDRLRRSVDYLLDTLVRPPTGRGTPPG